MEAIIEDCRGPKKTGFFNVRIGEFFEEGGSIWVKTKSQEAFNFSLNETDQWDAQEQQMLVSQLNAKITIT